MLRQVSLVRKRNETQTGSTKTQIKYSFSSKRITTTDQRKKNDWFIQKANDAERFHREKNHREFYATLNQVYGPTTKRSHAI